MPHPISSRSSGGRTSFATINVKRTTSRSPESACTAFALHLGRRAAPASQGAIQPGVPQIRRDNHRQGGYRERFVGQCAARYQVCEVVGSERLYAGVSGENGIYRQAHSRVFANLHQCWLGWTSVEKHVTLLTEIIKRHSPRPTQPTRNPKYIHICVYVLVPFFVV